LLRTALMPLNNNIQIAKLKFFVANNQATNKNNGQYIFGKPVEPVGGINKSNHPANKKYAQVNFKQMVFFKVFLSIETAVKNAL
jgi:hypothetical protein